MAGPNPFGVFSMEVWEMICDWMDNKEDILRTIETFPELSTLPNARKFSWLFSKVVSFVLPKYLNRDDILTCRLVSKRWKSAVENAIESHPDHFAYDPAALQGTTQFNYHKLQEKLRTNVERHVHFGFYGKLMRLNYQGNPFLGRRLKISVSRWNMNSLVNIQPLLREFGHHLWHANITIGLGSDFNESQLYDKIFEPLTKCFFFLPNLKTLKFYCQSDSNFRLQRHGRPQSNNSALLPHLEVLNMSKCYNISKRFYDMLESCFRINHVQIKKLGIHYNNWDRRLGSQFPNLTELELVTNIWNSTTTGHQLRKLLRDLQAPGLQKIRVEGIFYSDELLEILGPYQIKSLELEQSILDRYSRPRPHPTLNSIRILKTKVQQLQEIKYLTYLPMLEYLTIQYSKLHWEMQLDVEDTDIGDPISNCFYLVGKEEHVECAHFNCVWDALPNLKMLSVMKHGQVTRKYVREMRNRVFTSFNKTRCDC